jgi:hypothetical protein
MELVNEFCKAARIIRIRAEKPRNPLVVPAYMRKAGKHLTSARKCAKIERKLSEE